MAAQSVAILNLNVSSTKAKDGKKCFALFTVLRHSRRANGDIELTLT